MRSCWAWCIAPVHISVCHILIKYVESGRKLLILARGVETFETLNAWWIVFAVQFNAQYSFTVWGSHAAFRVYKYSNKGWPCRTTCKLSSFTAEKMHLLVGLFAQHQGWAEKLASLAQNEGTLTSVFSVHSSWTLLSSNLQVKVSCQYGGIS